MIVQKELSILASLLGVVYLATTYARVNEGDADAAAASQKSKQADLLRPHGDPTEFVVTAERRGEAKVAAEGRFTEEEISSHGVDSIQCWRACYLSSARPEMNPFS